MTEEEWLDDSDLDELLQAIEGEASNQKLRQLHGACCGRLDEMLQFLEGEVSDRKWRLLHCACCRSIWHKLTDERSRQAVEIAEQFADGAATKAELDAAREAAEDAQGDAWNAEGAYAAALAADVAWMATCEDAWEAVAGYPTLQDHDIGPNPRALLRDIIGNPFRPVTLAPSVLAWNDGTVPRIARGIYDERAFDRLPILADALLDAGCDDEDLLAHCRSGGEHVRGCWAVDLVLGLE